MSEKTQAKFDNFKGDVKEKAGDVLGQNDWKENGQKEQVESDAKYKKEQGKGFLKGAFDQVAGKAQETAGAVTGNKDLQQAGHDQANDGENKIEDSKN